jgi:hypothetical protein
MIKKGKQQMKHNSSITFDEAVQASMQHSFIKLYYNGKCIWNDDLTWEEGWVPLEMALDNFRDTHKDYDKIRITDMKVKIVEWHHSIIYLKGKEVAK